MHFTSYLRLILSKNKQISFTILLTKNIKINRNVVNNFGIYTVTLTTFQIKNTGYIKNVELNVRICLRLLQF
jgi:hypothetical protein